MNVGGLFGTLRRQWIATVLLLLMTLAGIAALAHRPGPYTATSQVVLLPSRQASKINGDNPYLSFTGPLTLTADLIRRELMDPRTQAVLVAEHYASAYQVVDDPDTSGPVLDITVTGRNKNSVEHTLRGVTAAVGSKLQAMQTGIKPSHQITSLAVSIDTLPTVKLSQKARPLVVVLGAGILLTIAIAQLLDAARGARARRRTMVGPAERLPGNEAERDTPVPQPDVDVPRRTLQADVRSNRGPSSSSGRRVREPGPPGVGDASTPGLSNQDAPTRWSADRA